MSDEPGPTTPIAAGSGLQLTGPHWTCILRLYGGPDVQQACLMLQDRFGVDVSLLLTLLCFAKDGVTFDGGDIEALDAAVAAWRRDVVQMLRAIRRQTKPAAGHDAAIAGFRNKIKAAEVEAEQIEIATLVRAIGELKPAAVPHHHASREAIAATVKTVTAFYAARAGAPIAPWHAPEMDYAIGAIADAVTRVANP